ncbi:hypothetical protein XENTR_v10024551 [Xenopus tropicalis]|nr:hypothetical protein XENTR_v10024551 [Xenopus tropicalis]
MRQTPYVQGCLNIYISGMMPWEEALLLVLNSNPALGRTRANKEGNLYNESHERNGRFPIVLHSAGVYLFYSMFHVK